MKILALGFKTHFPKDTFNILLIGAGGKRHKNYRLLKYRFSNIYRENKLN